MKAIVLTCDRYHPFALHMIKRYESLWPDHPFEFQLPYTERPGHDTTLSSPTSWIKTPPDIRNCILTLLQNIDDEEWLYWCIDDKYPITLNSEKAAEVLKFLEMPLSQDISGLSFARARKLWDPKVLTVQT